jgi:hypothetical protein
MVAVGTAIADRPPPRSQRAQLTHWAPPSGSGVEAMPRLRVQYPNWREEAVGHVGELIPMKERPLTAPFERL